MSRRRTPRDWPGLMKPATARAYLDDMSEAIFRTEVLPYLEGRTVGGEVHYTRESLDNWIDRGGRTGNPRTPAELMAMLDDDDAGSHPQNA